MMTEHRQKGMFSPKVPNKMPEGYYSGDKPNPNLHAFVEKHIKERPYDPETDDYDVPAFDKPIDHNRFHLTGASYAPASEAFGFSHK